MSLSYQQRFDEARPTYTRVNEKRFADLEPGTTVLIPSPPDIAAEIDALAGNELLNLTEFRRRLADRHGSDGACPVMTGMNLRIVAEIAFDALDGGTSPEGVVPVWKVIEPKTPLASKLSGGPDRIRELRAATAAG